MVKPYNALRVLSPERQNPATPYSRVAQWKSRALLTRLLQVRALLLEFMHRRARYLFDHWKLGVHLLFRTKRFGVNNKWRSPFDSIFGRSFKRQLLDVITIRPIMWNYRHMKLRAGSLAHFLTDEDFALAFGETKDEYLCRLRRGRSRSKIKYD